MNHHDEHAKANPWKTIVQLQAQLAQTRAELRGSYAGCRQRVSSLQAKLADAYAARDALAHECNQLEADREYNARLVEERDAELTQAQVDKKLAQQGHSAAVQEVITLRTKLMQARVGLNEVKTLWLSPAEAKGLRWQLERTGKRMDEAYEHASLMTTEAERLQRQLAQARKECVHAYIKKYDGLLAINHIQYAVGDILERLVNAKRRAERTEALVKELRGERDYWQRKASREEAEKCITRKEMATTTKEYYALLAKVEMIEQRAELAEAELSNGHKTLEAAGVPFADGSGAILSITGRVVKLRRRAKHAEALAALVTPELAALLERLAHFATRGLEWYDQYHHDDPRQARALAARIREALEEAE